MNVSTPSKKSAVVYERPSCDEVYAKDMACVRDPAMRAKNRDCIRVYYSYDLCQYLRKKGEAVVVTVRRADG
jgi:hypothetical protein